VLLQVGQDLLLLLDLPAVVLCLLVRYLYLELVVVQLLLLPLDLDAELHVLFLQPLPFPFHLLVDALLLLWGLVRKHTGACAGRQSADEFLALLSQHFQLFFWIELVVSLAVVFVVELRNADVAFHPDYKVIYVIL
jgi:hypothetical protein